MRLSKIEKCAFPNENLTPRDKLNSDWRLQYAKAAYAAYVESSSQIGINSVKDYQTIRSYAMGTQNTEQYKKCLAPGQDVSKINLQVNWKILPILPKFRRTVVGLVTKAQDYDIVINPVDALAKSEIQDKLIEAQGKILLRQALKQQALQEFETALPLHPDVGEPDDLDGIEVMSMGLRHQTAMEAEQVVELVFSQNKFEKIRKRFIEQLFDYGVAVVKDETQNDRIHLRNCDLRRLVISHCANDDFSDMKYVGEIRHIPVSEMPAYTEQKLSREDLQKLYNSGRTYSWGRSSTPYDFTSFSTFDSWWLNGSVPILELELKTVDNLIFNEREDSRGNKHFGKAPKQNDKSLNKKVENIYCIKWLIGTDCVFGPARPEKTKRDSLKMAKAKFSYHVVATEMEDMKTFSRMETLIPYADEIQLAWYKLQHALNSAVPKGMAIDLTALEDVSLSSSGKKLAPKDILDLYFQRGVLVYRRNSLVGENANARWIEELQNGIGNEIAEYSNIISIYIDLIRQTLGVNELTDGSTPNSKTLVPVANLAAAGTSNALSDIFEADRSICPDIAESVVIRAQAMIRDGKTESFIKALGYGTTTILKLTPDIDRYTYGVTIESRPTAVEQQTFENALQTALSTGQINIDDYLRAKNISNIKQAERYLAYKVQKNRDIAQQESKALQLQNAQIQAEASQAAEMAKQSTLEFEYTLKSKFSAQENAQKMQQLEVEWNFKLEAERIGATGRVDAATVQAMERQSSNIRNNQTKLLNEDKDDKLSVVELKEDLRSAVVPTTNSEEPFLEIPENFSFLPPI